MWLCKDVGACTIVAMWSDGERFRAEICVRYSIIRLPVTGRMSADEPSVTGRGATRE